MVLDDHQGGDPVDEESLGWVGNLRDLKDTSIEGGSGRKTIW